MGRLDGRVIVISGGARGMGRACAERVLDEGGSAVIGDVLLDVGSATADELGERCSFVPLDVTDVAAWSGALAHAESMGAVRGLVNNAGIHSTAPIEHAAVDDFRSMFEVNLLGTVLGMQAALEPLRRAGGGSIVNLSSTAGLTGLPYHGAYGASKWAVRGITKTAAVEFGRDDIRVNSVHPGPVQTDMLPEHRRGDEFFTHLPLGRSGAPSEIAALVCYLLSDDSSFQTGTEFVADGGSMAGPAPTYEWVPGSTNTD